MNCNGSKHFFSKRQTGLKSCLAFLFLFVILFSSVSAKPIVTTETVEGFIIEHPVFDPWQQNTARDFYIHVFNQTNGHPMVSQEQNISCYLHLYFEGDKGEHILSGADSTSGNNPNNDFEIGANAANFSRTGQYAYIIWCNSSNGRGGFEKGTFMVEPYDIQIGSTTSNWQVFLILSLFSLILLVIALWTENFIFTFVAGCAFIVTGIYSMAYGYGEIRDTYTRSIAFIEIGLGIFLVMYATYGLAFAEKGADD